MNQNALPLKKLSWLAVFFLPFISLPVMPSTYRPVSVYFLLLPALLFFTNYKSKEEIQDRNVVLFFLYVVFYGLVAAFFSEKFVGLNYISELVAVIIGLLVYLGFRFIFHEYGLNWFFRVTSFSYKFVVVVGLIEVLSSAGLLPYSVKELINLAFSGKSHSRIQLTTMEAAWGARVFLFLFITYLYSNVDHGVKKIIFIVLGLFLFLSTFSMAMMSYLALGVLFYFLIIYKFKGVAYLFFISIISYFSLLFLMSVFEMLGMGGYHLNRLEALLYGDFYQLQDMLYYDQSIFIRMGYPLLAVFVYLDNLGGVGLGQYSAYFGEYLVDVYGVSVLSFPEVFSDVYSSDGDPRSLPAKALVELSIIGLFIYFYLFYSAYIYRNREYNLYKTLFFCLALASSFTMGTWAYMYVWMALAMMPASGHGRRNCE